MGTISMFVAAPAAELLSKKLSDGIPAGYATVQCNHVDELKLANLEHILTGRDPKESLKGLMEQCVFSHDESGITMLRLGDGLVKSLAALTPTSAVEPSKRWLAESSWGGFGRRGGDLRELVDVVVAISRLAAAAQAPDYGLFFWDCP